MNYKPLFNSVAFFVFKTYISIKYLYLSLKQIRLAIKKLQESLNCTCILV